MRARNYFRDLYETDLQENDLMTSISFPLAGETTVCAFREFVRRRGDFASTGLVVNAELEDGVFTSFSPVFFCRCKYPGSGCRDRATTGECDADERAY